MVSSQSKSPQNTTQYTLKNDIKLPLIQRNTREFRNINALIDLPKYRLPLAGIVSILHRISGFIMAALLPLIVCALNSSLYSESSYDAWAHMASAWYIKLFILGIAWAFFHHLCAGIRHLIMDLHIGMSKNTSKISAQCVLVASLSITALLAFQLFN